MVGEEFGWVPLDGWSISFLIIEVLIVLIIPGFLLSLALFPKRKRMSISERFALSFGLGLAAPFLLALLNITLEVRVEFITSLLVVVFLSIVGILGFVNRGGNLNLIKWYTTKESD